MGENSTLKENEKEANLVVAKVMRVTFFIFTLVFMLNVIGVFVVPMNIMTVAYVVGALCLWCPTILVNVCKLQGAQIKYINTLCAVLFVTIVTLTLTFHVTVLYVYGIAIASLYFSKKLNVIATISTVAGVSAGQMLAFQLETLIDKNFDTMQDVMIYGVLPRALILVAVAAIFTMLTSRTASLLSNLMGAEEQKNMLESMRKMRDNAAQTSETLIHMVEELATITETSLQANQRIAEESEQLFQGSMENQTTVEGADKRIQDMTEQLAGLSVMNHKTALLAKQIGENTQENQKRMEDATGSMAQIHESTDACKQIISQLGEASKEIMGIIKTITGISSRTNILALNASIEAARAGEHGKGFAVVAEEIQQLSEQTKTAVESIGTIVRQVVEKTEDAVEAMEQNVILTQNGMESIQKANESAVLITGSNEEMVGQILAIDETAEAIKTNSKEVSDSMNQVRDNARRNCDAVEHVTAATQENSAGTEGLSNIVEQIKGLSEQLNQVVQG